ncbi:hypothetical protein FNF29_02722 [Cafeteria roenbergensis]|uniref:ferroxidase n=1 Tax=Cafeteria roenbergensis TaxID=33653 RepID=A0A5A8CMX1_CAFRO|nr:hypothetical protein FNF29_02722 [Cafeteria roenbergensis]|eukprot:KAA0154099.1 hypothetical protein FNF29_02722 [Cafeteria roenbergensis]
MALATAEKRGAPMQFSQRFIASECAAEPVSELNEAEFHGIADDLLEDLEGRLDALDDFLDDAELTNSQGVLTASLGDKGTYVLNKQTPNRQVWWSSPVSGPKRFYWNAEEKKWMGTRDGTELVSLLRRELKQLLGSEFEL